LKIGSWDKGANYRVYSARDQKYKSPGMAAIFGRRDRDQGGKLFVG